MDKLKKNVDIVLGVAIFLLFVVYTLIIKFVAVLPIGPLESNVGLGQINKAVHDFVGVNMTLYNITDWLGILAILIMFAFAVVGVVQWIKRKSLLKVDNEILALGIYYVLVFASYLFFEFVVINRRPVLIEGILEASYPSSTTMLVMMVCLSSFSALNKLISNKKSNLTLKIILILFTIFMIVARFISGVHWLTDIFGGIILSTALLFIYKFILRVLNLKNKKSSS